MAGSSTTYNVSVKYTLDDRASSGLKGIGAASDRASKSASTLKGALIGAGIASIGLLHEAKKHLLDFNSEMFNLKNSMTTVMQMNMHMPFEKAHAAAEKLFFVFQEMAKRSPGMTSDFMEMAASIAPAVAMAGGGVQKLQKMTEGAVKAGIAFHIRPDQMAMDIQEMIQGNVRLTSRTARQLISSQGLDHKEFNALSADKRASMTEKILTDPAVLAGSERAAHSMAGEISTIKDNMQIAFGEAGKPLMDAMTKDFRQINEWIVSHPKKIQEWSTTFSQTLTKGFSTFKTIAQWFISHGDTLMSLAKAFLIFKGTQIAGGLLGSVGMGGAGIAKLIGDQIGNFRKGYNSSVYRGPGQRTAWLDQFFGEKGGMREGMTRVVAGFGGIVPTVAIATTAISAFAAAISLATSFLDSQNSIEERNKRNREAAMSLKEAIGDYPAFKERQKQIDQMLGSSSLANPQTGPAFQMRYRLMEERDRLSKSITDPEMLGLALRKIDEASVKHGGASLKDMELSTRGLLDPRLIAHLPDTFDSTSVAENTQIMKEVDQTLKTFQNLPTEMRDKVLEIAFPNQFGPKNMAPPEPAENWHNLEKADVNVTIQKVEVASEDPDRFVFGLVKVAEDGLRHATQSAHTIPGGF